MKQYGFKLFTDITPFNPYGQKQLGPIFPNRNENVDEPYKNIITDEDKWFEYLQMPNTPKRGFSYTGIPYRVDRNFVTERNFFAKSDPYDIDDIRSLYFKDKAKAIKALAEYIAANDIRSPLSLSEYLNRYDMYFGNYDNPLYAVEVDNVLDDDIDDNSINGINEELDLKRDNLAEYQASRIRPVKLLSLDYHGKKSLDDGKLNNDVLNKLEDELKLYKDKQLSFEKFNRLYSIEQLKDFVNKHKGQIGSDHIIKAIKRRF